jgi:hypothetical protein
MCIYKDAKTSGSIGTGVRPGGNPGLASWVQEGCRAKELLAVLGFNPTYRSQISCASPGLQSGERVFKPVLILRYINEGFSLGGVARTL